MKSFDFAQGKLCEHKLLCEFYPEQSEGSKGLDPSLSLRSGSERQNLMRRRIEICRDLI